MPPAHAHSKYADFEGLREQAITLRREGYSLRQIRDELKIFDSDILNQLVKGEPPPEWTKRPNAKDDLRDKARGCASKAGRTTRSRPSWAAEQYWADLVGTDRAAFNKTTLKKHNPKTVRKNVGESYRGRLVIKVLKSADLYRRIEGAWYGIVLSDSGT